MDDQGTKHIVGFVNMTIEPPLAEKDIAGHQVSIETIGVNIISSPVMSGVSLGYNKESLLTLRNNSLVTLEGTSKK